MNKLNEILARIETLEAEAKDESKRQSNESLEALRNDLGLVLNPYVNMAASVASELLEYRSITPRLARALSIALDISHPDLDRRNRVRAIIENIITEEK